MEFNLSKIRRKIFIAWVTTFVLIAVLAMLARLFPYEIPPLVQSKVYLDRFGTPIAEIAYDNRVRHREIDYDEIPGFFVDALLTMEDRTFWTNPGISMRGLVRAMKANLEAGKIVEGGSTISSGLARNLDGVTNSRSMIRKATEFVDAIRLNLNHSKKEIITAYVNRVSFGKLAYGLSSASELYFGKSPENLTKAEQIALLVLPRNPVAYDPKREGENFRKRFELITKTLEENGKITPEESEQILSEPLVWKKYDNPLPYAVDYLESLDTGRAGFIQTTFDIPLTRRVDALAKSVLSEIGWKNVNDYGIYMVDRETHEVRVMIGGSNYGNELDGQVNSVLSPRQVGSTLKPFIYLLAFEKFALTPDDVILDLPVSYKTTDDFSYEPKNYSLDYKGAITYAEALAQSINVPAVKTLERIGTAELLRFLHSLGITTLNEAPEHYGLSLALWSGEISLKELTDAYSIFANEGEFCKMKIFSDEPSSCEKKVDAKYIAMIESILTSRVDKMRSFPIWSALDFENAKVFVKTGTSRNFRDNWAIGYTDHYLIGVWAGNKNAENMRGVSGATGAGEIFGRIVREIDPSPSDRRETVSERSIAPFLSVTSPLERSVYTIDPTKDVQLQGISILFQTNVPYEKAVYELDGKSFEGSTLPLEAGSHSLKIRLIQGNRFVKEAVTTYEIRY